MMSRIRKILLNTLGEKRYLRLLAGTFQQLYKTGKLGIDYQDIYFLKNIVRPGDVCIDIGAHLGYFTLELSRLVLRNGHVYAIEPMSKFFNTLTGIVHRKGLKNISLFQNAMGADSEYVEMGIPRVNNIKKFAYARAVESSTFLEYVESERVKNLRGDESFFQLPRVDFIKCDVEGLEISVFQSLLKTIQKHRPVILCELGDPQDRKKLLDILGPFSYQMFYLKDKKLNPLEPFSDIRPVSHNHYFIPENRIQSLSANF
jgi:FkbM family methyltransferase